MQCLTSTTARPAALSSKASTAAPLRACAVRAVASRRPVVLAQVLIPQVARDVSAAWGGVRNGIASMRTPSAHTPTGTWDTGYTPLAPPVLYEDRVWRASSRRPLGKSYGCAIAPLVVCSDRRDVWFAGSSQ